MRRWRCPAEAAVEVALRTQQIIAYESGVADTVDPLAGSYYVEALTDEIERRALASTSSGSMRWAARARPSRRATSRTRSRTRPTRRCRAVESGEQVVVGVNKFQTQPRGACPLTCSGSTKRCRPSKSPGFATVRASRDAVKVAGVLARIQAAAQDPAAPLMPLFVEAVSAYATLGEICNTLRGVFGEYRP